MQYDCKDGAAVRKMVVEEQKFHSHMVETREVTGDLLPVHRDKLNVLHCITTPITPFFAVKSHHFPTTN